MMYRVIQASTDRYVVQVGYERIVMCARKKSKGSRMSIVAGDWVSFVVESNQPVIISTEQRKNILTRPRVANIDSIIAVVAPLPKTDFEIIDKLSYNCAYQGIDFVICINKIDLDSDFANYVKKRYIQSAQEIVTTSAIQCDVLQLQQVLKGKLSCLAGHSAVGKSTLINCLVAQANQRTGKLIQKTNKGRQTTSVTTIFEVEEQSYIVDSPGFRDLMIQEIASKDLAMYCKDFDEYSANCYFNSCTHTTEPHCAIKTGVQQGRIDGDRYRGYVSVYNQLVHIEKENHKKGIFRERR